MTVTSKDIANQAITLVGDETPAVTAGAPNFDNSKAGKALQNLYTPCVQTIGRQFGWDFARSLVALSLSGNTAPVPWTLEYLYPGNGVEIYQLQPPAFVDPNNPLPVTWSVGNTLVMAVQKKVIWSNLASAIALYNNNPTEDTWDAGFREAVVRLLASELAMALFGKPDLMQTFLESAGQFESIAQRRGD